MNGLFDILAIDGANQHPVRGRYQRSAQVMLLDGGEHLLG
jgi:hypothetical protein